jgi:hypothetical protein
MSALANLFDRITNRRRDRELSAQEQLSAAARKHAKGETVDVGAVEECLFTTGQSIDDFRRLCEFEETRRDCFAKLEQGSSMKVRLEKIDAQVAAENAKYQEIAAGFESRLAKLELERSQVSPAVSAAASARTWLLDAKNVQGTIGDDYRDALAREQEASIQSENLQRAMKETKNEIRFCDVEIEAIRTQHDRSIGESWRPREPREAGQPHNRPLPEAAQEKIDDIEKKRARLSRKLSENQAEFEKTSALLTEAKNEVAAIQKRLLQP